MKKILNELINLWNIFYNNQINNKCICSVWINVVPPDGIPRRIAGYKDESLLDVIKRSHIPDIFGININTLIRLILDECDGGDNELKPYHVPIDFYSAGVMCGQC